MLGLPDVADRTLQYVLRDAGLTGDGWDREAAGIVLRRSDR